MPLVACPSVEEADDEVARVMKPGGLGTHTLKDLAAGEIDVFGAVGGTAPTAPNEFQVAWGSCESSDYRR